MIGMLWYDNSQKPLADKIRAAAHHYVVKYGHLPTWTQVARAGGVQQVDQIQVTEATYVLPNHLWIGHGELRA